MLFPPVKSVKKVFFKKVFTVMMNCICIHQAKLYAGEHAATSQIQNLNANTMQTSTF